MESGPLVLRRGRRAAGDLREPPIIMEIIETLQRVKACSDLVRNSCAKSCQVMPSPAKSSRSAQAKKPRRRRQAPARPTIRAPATNSHIEEEDMEFIPAERSITEIEASLLNYLKNRARLYVPTQNPRMRPRTPTEAFTVKRQALRAAASMRHGNRSWLRRLA